MANLAALIFPFLSLNAECRGPVNRWNAWGAWAAPVQVHWQLGMMKAEVWPHSTDTPCIKIQIVKKDTVLFFSVPDRLGKIHNTFYSGNQKFLRRAKVVVGSWLLLCITTVLSKGLFLAGKDGSLLKQTVRYKINKVKWKGVKRA